MVKAYLLHFLALVAVLTAVLLPLWLSLRRSQLRRNPLREAALALFVVYMGALLVLVWRGRWGAPEAMLRSALNRLQTGEGINLRLFSVVRSTLRGGNWEHITVYLGGNIIMFLPWGFFLPLLWERFRHPGPAALSCLLLTACIETGQLFIHRMVDVDDLLLNWLGGMAGWVAWRLLAMRSR